MVQQNVIDDNLARLNQSPREVTEARLRDCCGSTAWARQMADARPFADVAALLQHAEQIWHGLTPQDWLEAFAAHPKIGERKAAQPAQSAHWSRAEQSGIDSAGDAVRDALAEANRLYEKKFGYIFIVCATGRSASEMLELCRARLKHDAATELPIAAEEQRKITEIRLRKLMSNPQTASQTPQSITTHILDISRGRPASGVAVTLERETATGWQLLGQGVTDDDGRARNLLATPLQTGIYRLTFDTGAYFARQSVAGFYPQVTVNFVVPDAAQHYHVPLLLSPFGYSTYRGS